METHVAVWAPLPALWLACCLQCAAAAAQVHKSCRPPLLSPPLPLLRPAGAGGRPAHVPLDAVYLPVQPAVGVLVDGAQHDAAEAPEDPLAIRAGHRGRQPGVGAGGGQQVGLPVWDPPGAINARLVGGREDSRGKQTTVETKRPCLGLLTAPRSPQPFTFSHTLFTFSDAPLCLQGPDSLPA